MEAKDLSFEEIAVGSSAHLEKVWTEDEVNEFAKLSGDYNPLHVDADYAQKNTFNKKVVYGMLLASSFSNLIGMQLPGKRCLLLSSHFDFKQPVYIGENLSVSVTVLSKVTSTQVVTLLAEIKRDDKVVVKGEIKTLVR